MEIVKVTIASRAIYYFEQKAKTVSPCRAQNKRRPYVTERGGRLDTLPYKLGEKEFKWRTDVNDSAQ